MSKSIKLIIVGVGGQGILTVSEILGTAAIMEGLPSVMSEVHGMAQRGGVVTTEMKIGDFKSPLVEKGSADIILGFEPVETYRTLEKANTDTRIVTNIEPLVPPSVSAGQGQYPSVDELIKNMRDAGLKVITVNAQKLADEAGVSMAGNIVMLGAMSALDNFILSKSAMHKAMEKRIPQKWLSQNIKAFESGYELGKH